MVESGFECREDVNTFEFMSPSLTIELTSHWNEDCPGCDPIYGDMNNKNQAIAYCQTKCADDYSCTGFFYRKEFNGAEWCNLFSPLNLDTATYEPNWSWSGFCYKTDFYCTRDVDKYINKSYRQVDLIEGCPTNDKDYWCGEPAYMLIDAECYPGETCASSTGRGDYSAEEYCKGMCMKDEECTGYYF